VLEIVTQKAQDAFTEHSVEKDIATSMKRALEQENSGTWHVVVGRSFGASCTHACKLLYFIKLGSHFVLAFKSAE